VTRRWPTLLLLLAAACGSSRPEPEAAVFDEGPVVDPLVRRYDAPFSGVWAAAEEALVGEGVAIDRHRRGLTRGVLVGYGGLGLRVKIRIRSVEEGRIEAGVDILPRDPTLAAMLQDRISDKLSLHRAKAALLGQTSLERTYRDDLEHCMAAAEGACRALQLDIVYKHLEDSRGRLEGRDDSGRSARFTLRALEGIGHGTQAILSTEAPPDGEKDFFLQVIREFERDLIRAGE
jgi:hypothetical protein